MGKVIKLEYVKEAEIWEPETLSVRLAKKNKKQASKEVKGHGNS